MYEQFFGSQILFGDSPNNKPSIEQIINGEATAIWEIESPAQILVKKKIVITDWFYAQNLFPNKTVIELYEKLLNAGFLLYVWNNKQLVPVQEVKKLEATLKKTAPVQPEILSEAMKQQGISQDALFLCDTPGVCQLVKTLIDPKFKQQITWNNIKNLPQIYQKDLLAKLPKLTSLLLVPDKNDLNGDGLPIAWLQKISNLRFNNNLPEEQTWYDIARLCTNCPGLKILELSFCEDLGEFPDEFVLPATLEELDADGTNITWQGIARLCKNCSGLKILDLSRCKNLGEFPEKFVLPATLETLIADATDLIWQDLACFYKNCPGLKILELSCCKNLGEFPENFILPATLESLRLNSANITWQSIAHLYKNCPGLKILELSFCNNLGELSDEFALPATLESLSVRATKITWRDIARICKHCPGLKILNLGWCENLGKLPENFTCPPGLRIISDPTQIPRGSQASSQRGLDGKTGQTNDELDVRTLFKPKKDGIPKLEHYRLGVYTHMDEATKKLKQNPQAPKKIIGEKCLSQNGVDVFYESKLTDESTYFLGCFTLAQGMNDWVALPSLTLGDKINPNEIQLTPPMLFDLAYCAEEALYYIRPTTPLSSSVVVTFIVAALEPANNIAPIMLSQEQEKSLKSLQFDENGKLVLGPEHAWLNDDNKRQALIAYCKNFKEKKLLNPNATGIALVNEILREQAGHCRHRAHVFIALAKAFNLPCRYISNDCHAYVEILDNKTQQWTRVDLGGTEVKLNITPFQKTLENSTDSQDNISVETIDPSNPFCTWNTQPSKAGTFPAYADELLQVGENLDEGKRNLLCTLAREQIDGLHEALLGKAKENGKKLYFIQNLNQVPQHQIVVDNEQGTYQKQDSALMEFLQNAKQGDVLLVNWSDYQAQHVGFNTIMDKERKLKDRLIDKGVTVISLLSHDKKAEMGEDFYSRCRAVSSMPAALSASPITMPEVSSMVLDNPEDIYFYDDDWQSIMIGRLQLTPKGYAHTQAPFIKALQEKKNPLVLHNAPWHLPAFRAFMRSIKSQGVIQANGQEYALNEVQLYRDDSPYDLTKSPIQPLNEIPAEETMYILNQKNRHAFFGQYYTKEGKFMLGEGLLAQCKQTKSKILNVLLTESLTNGQWKKLCSSAQEHGVQINLATSPGVELPQEFTLIKAMQINPTQASIQLTDDIGYTLKDAGEDTLTIRINEKTTAADLLERTKSTGEGKERQYHNQPCALSKALLNGKTVILSGNPSPALMAGLASLFLPNPYLLLNGERQAVTGHIKLVSEAVKGLDFVNVETLSVTQKACWQALFTKYPQDSINHLKQACEDFVSLSKHPAFNYTQLDQMLARMQWNPNANPIKSLLRLHPEYQRLKPLAETAWGAQKPESKSRLQKVQEELAHSPYIFLAGNSGVGKSYFVRKQLGKTFKICVGMDKIGDFLIKGDKPKCLFIDEANLLDPDSLEIFQGLFNEPPQLLVNGQLEPIPEGHKVVFAGNPGHFQGRREIPFFAEHGHIITFKPFSADELRQEILKPILDILYPQTAQINALKPMQDILIKIYEKYGDKLSLTTRNLEMMALRCKGLTQKIIGNIKQLACLCAYDEIGSLMNDKERATFRNWCQEEFNVTADFLKDTKNHFKAEVQSIGKGFFLTQSRRNPIRILDNVMTIRDSKIKHPELQKKGISAVLMEGEAGIGKSLLAINYLESKGFVSGKNQPNAEKKYYHFTPSESLDVIKQTLFNAFHEGAVVIIDELNTLPLETLLNDYLSGVDVNGSKPNKQGFTLIATQNPITYAKRQPLSTALQNRFQKINLKNYPLAELTEIMAQLSNSNEFAEKQVQQFSRAVKIAEAQNLHPKPTTRHLLVEGEKHGMK